MICTANQLTVFYMRATLALNGLRRKWENMHTATEHKLQWIASSQSTHNTLFYVHIPTIGKVSSITRKKRLDNDYLRKLWTKNNCEIVVILHSFTNKFQPLDLSIKKAARQTFLKSTTLGWHLDDVKVFLLLSVIKPLYIKWVVDLYHRLKADKKMVVNGFRESGISEAIENA